LIRITLFNNRLQNVFIKTGQEENEKWNTIHRTCVYLSLTCQHLSSVKCLLATTFHHMFSVSNQH